MGPEKLSDIFWNGHNQAHKLLWDNKKNLYILFFVEFIFVIFLSYCILSSYFADGFS